MSLIEAIILGIVQGLTEFLPVSSSGHIEIFKVLMGVEIKEALLLTVLLHLATALSTMIIYRKDLIQIIGGSFSKEWNWEKRFSLAVIISMIPAALVGLFLEDAIEQLFSGNMVLVGCMLLLTAVILYFSDKAKKESSGQVSYPKAVILGIVQAIAVLPGISRSGSTIGSAVLLGMDRGAAARFSFIMVLPLILGASAKKLLEYNEVSSTAGAESLSSTVLIAGFLAAFFSGLLALKWMIALVQQSQLKWFALYCSIAGLIALVSGLYS